MKRGGTDRATSRLYHTDGTAFVVTCQVLRHIIAAAAVGMMIVHPVAGRSDGQKRLTGPATGDEIAALIRDLGDPSYEKRAFATRRLCAIGMPAAERLRAAAADDDLETAFRAKVVLAALDRIMFAGVEVRLTFSKTRIAWNEPVDLNITMLNRSKYPARVPFEIDPAKRNSVAHDARHVGDMLDVAEHLHVGAPDGGEIELKVDDIAADPAVVAAVQQRLNRGPTGLLEPGQQVAIICRAFNRGWARYPLLEAGVYTVVMDYVPQWQNDALAAERVGRVVSSRGTITVTNSAPESVSREGAEASLAIRRDGPYITALLTNRTDQPMLVNKNFGASPPFAEGRWVWELDEARREVPLIPKPAASWHDFDAALLIEVQPGRSLELARIHVDELRRALCDSGAKLDPPRADRWSVHFSYVNLCDRKWQARQGPELLGNLKAPKIFQRPLPRRILSARHASNRLTVPSAD